MACEKKSRNGSMVHPRPHAHPYIHPPKYRRGDTSVDIYRTNISIIKTL